MTATAPTVGSSSSATLVTPALMKKGNFFVMINPSDKNFEYYPMKVNSKDLDDKKAKIAKFDKAPAIVADGFYITSSGHVYAVSADDIKRMRLRKTNVSTFKKFADDNKYTIAGKDGTEEPGGADSVIEAEDDPREANEIIEMQVQAVHG